MGFMSYLHRRRQGIGQFPVGGDTSLKNSPPEGHKGGVVIAILEKLAPLKDRKDRIDKLTKLLMNVSIERSIGPIQVVMSPENTVSDLIKATTKIYVKERRRPLLKQTDPELFQLHYSSYSLESLRPDEKLINLGSRNFFLCSKHHSIPLDSSDF